MTNKEIPKRVTFNTDKGENPLVIKNMLGAPKNMVYLNNSIVDVPISDVEPYDNNPRRSRNPEKWAELKESIRNVGVKYHVKVVKRPASNKYMIAAGGNSRLLILRELFEETKDPKFATIPAQEVDFVSEDDLLVQHILENEQRAEVAFWDKACAYEKLVQRLGLVNGSYREISERLISLGLSISHGKVGEFLFATIYLQQLKNLCSNLSGDKTIALRKAFYDLQKSKNLLQPPSESEFKDFWDNQLFLFARNKNVGDDLNVKELVQHIHAAHTEKFPKDPDAIIKAAAPTTNKGVLEQPSLPHPAPVDVAAAQAEAVTPAMQNTKPNPLVSAVSSLMHVAVDGAAEVLTEDELSERAQLIAAVQSILDYVNLGDTMRECESMPYGFYIEVPELDNNAQNIQYLIEQRHEESRQVFWFISEFSTQADVMKQTYARLPEDSQYRFYMVNSIGESQDAMAVNAEFHDVLGQADFDVVQRWLMFSDENFVNLIERFFRVLRKHGVNDDSQY